MCVRSILLRSWWIRKAWERPISVWKFSGSDPGISTQKLAWGRTGRHNTHSWQKCHNIIQYKQYKVVYITIFFFSWIPNLLFSFMISTFFMKKIMFFHLPKKTFVKYLSKLFALSKKKLYILLNTTIIFYVIHEPDPRK